MQALTAKQAHERMLEISKQLDACDFSPNYMVAVHEEDGSFALYHDAFAVTEGDWGYVFREHGSPLFLYIGDGGGDVMMLERKYEREEYEVDAINKRRAANPYVQKYMKPRDPIK